MTQIELSKEMELEAMEQREVSGCEYCEGSGIASFPNGEDDYYTEFCVCEKGIALQLKEEN